MRDIVLVTNYWHFKDEKVSSRYRFLGELISNSEHKLEIITSSFYHGTKKQRKYSEEYLNKLDYKVTLINEPGYKKNISLKRIYSHSIFAKNVEHYLSKRKKPDLIYCVVPSLDVADNVTKYAEKNNIPLIIDIQDLWPEAYKMVIDIPVVSDVLFKPMELKANRIYRRANSVVSVSQTYANRALQVNNRMKEGLSVYLGVDLKEFDILVDKNKIDKAKDEFWITYIGTLGHSYNIPLMIDAISLLNRDDVKFNVIGDGPLKEKFEEYANKRNINIEFTGRLEYGKMIAYLKQSDVGVNPIIESSAASIINKVADYAAAGIPVINTQKSQEYRDLIKFYDAGVNCSCNDPKDISEKILYLIENPDKKKQMGSNSRRLAEEKFDRNKTYRLILNEINKLINKQEGQTK